MPTESLINPPLRRYSPRFTTAAAANCLSNVAWLLQPLLMFYLIDTRGFSEPIAGLILAAEIGSMAIVSSVITRMVDRANALRIGRIGALITIAATFMTMMVQSEAAFLLTRLVAGAGAGAALMLSITLACLSPDPSRCFGWFGVINNLFGVCLLASVPVVHYYAPAVSPFSLMAFAFLLLFVPLMALKSADLDFSHADNPHLPDLADAPPFAPTFMLVMSGLLVVVINGIMWALYSLIGEEAGLGQDVIASVISASIVAALLGSGLAAWIGDRFGTLLPLSASLAIIIMVAIVLSSGPSQIVFPVAACLNVASIYFFLPYLYSIASKLDGRGKAANYIGSSMYFAGAAAPLAGGILVSTIGIGIIAYIAVPVGVMMVISSIFAIRYASNPIAGLEVAAANQPAE